MISAVLPALLAACEDFRNDQMVDDTVYLRSENESLVQEYSVFDEIFRFGVIKAGRGLSAATVELGIAPADSVLAYNERHKTDFVPLSKSLYNADQIDGKVITIEAKAANARIEVRWNPAAMVAKMSSEPDNFVIPVYIRNSNLAVNPGKAMLLIRPVLSSVTVRETDNYMQCQTGSTATGKVGLRLDNPIPGHDVRVKLAFRPKAVTVNGIPYQAAPEGSIKLVREYATIKAGDMETDVEVALDLRPVDAGVSHISGEIVIEGAEVVIENGTNIDYIPVVTDRMVVRVIRK